jgi:hypothetical protein
MYQLVSAIVKPISSGGRWRNMDIGNVQLNALFRDFKRVIATLSNPNLTANVSFDIAPYLAALGGSTLTFNEWLVQNGNLTLPTTNNLPVIEPRYAKFADAVHGGYKVTPVHPTAASDATIPVEAKTDLQLTRANTDYALLYKHCLANVNGFYHRTDYSPNGLYIVDGMRSCLHGKRNEVGLLSFMALGELEFIQLTEDMIYTLKEGESLKTNCYFDTGVDLSQKTVMLVLGGYLQQLDQNAFYRISQTAFGINFGQLPLIDRYYETYKVLNLEDLGMESSPNSNEQISVEDLYSDAVLKRLLTMSQSFIVVLDKQDIFFDYVNVKRSPYPGCYTSFVRPVYPLVVGHGRHEVYWPRTEYDRWSININNAWHGEHNYTTVKTTDLHSVSDAQIASHGYRNDDAQFLLIGSDV